MPSLQLVERSLQLLSHVHGGDSLVAVRLSGLVHTTDRLAMRSIAVQLAAQGFASRAGQDGELDEGDYVSLDQTVRARLHAGIDHKLPHTQSSNSATMATLLRLLEPSSATATASADPSSSAPAAPIAPSKPLVIVVDEFDLFAQHPRQSFLYCLLDIVQGNRRRGGVAVIGVSARVVRPNEDLTSKSERQLTMRLTALRSGLSLAAREAGPVAMPVARLADDPAFVVHRFLGARQAHAFCCGNEGRRR